MASEIVSLQRVREERTPHSSGKAICTACNHNWIAVAPVGTVWLQCPNCSTERGLFEQHHEPEAGTLVWSCKLCDGHLFSVITDGRCICAGCGETHYPWARP